MSAIKWNSDYQSVCSTTFRCRPCDREWWHSELGKMSKLVRQEISFQVFYLKFYLWHHRETTLWFMLSSQHRCWAYVILTALHNHTTQWTQSKHTYTDSQSALSNSLLPYNPPDFQARFLSFLTTRWWMFPPCITALQCLFKALLLNLCCFNLPGRRSPSASCQGSPRVMRRSRLKCNNILLPHYVVLRHVITKSCLFVRADTWTACKAVYL